ncbi:hypothetical protein [Streptomyces lavendofoliae]|uniref:Uncharacterized protein n=1 Tax=Streptomyces lavendofoliae TaxID=67314 RepID=A0A918M6E0_9ACTN|nr:hypothetical protein [Streptomyces lavendofoliae]GGU52475.1 hypothetical protein GCM10010274_46750 [Streptomyces lavendofoliae]
MPKPTYILTATSRTGQKVNLITGGPTDFVAVYDEADLKRRLEAAKADPRDLDVTVQRVN